MTCPGLQGPEVAEARTESRPPGSTLGGSAAPHQVRAGGDDAVGQTGQHIERQRNRKGTWEVALLGFMPIGGFGQGSQPPHLPSGVTDRTPPGILGETEWRKEGMACNLARGYHSLR